MEAAKRKWIWAVGLRGIIGRDQDIHLIQPDIAGVCAGILNGSRIIPDEGGDNGIRIVSLGE